MQLHSRRFLRRDERNLDFGKLQPVPEKVYSNNGAVGSAVAPEWAAKRRSASPLMNLPSQCGTNCCPSAEMSNVREKSAPFGAMKASQETEGNVGGPNGNKPLFN